VGTALLVHGIRADLKSFLGVEEMDWVINLHIAFVNCKLSGFWGLGPQTPTGALPLYPAGDFHPPDPLCPP